MSLCASQKPHQYFGFFMVPALTSLVMDRDSLI